VGRKIVSGGPLAVGLRIDEECGLLVVGGGPLAVGWRDCGRKWRRPRDILFLLVPVVSWVF